MQTFNRDANEQERRRKRGSRTSPAKARHSLQIRHHSWRPTERARNTPCPLCDPALSCEADIVWEFGMSEFQDADMQRVALNFTHGLGWRPAHFLDTLLTLSAWRNVHYRSRTRWVFDLDFSCFESLDDGCGDDPGDEMDALRQWVTATYGKFWWPGKPLPRFTAIGRTRFMTATSVLVAGYPELADALGRIAERKKPPIEPE